MGWDSTKSPSGPRHESSESSVGIIRRRGRRTGDARARGDGAERADDASSRASGDARWRVLERGGEGERGTVRAHARRLRAADFARPRGRRGGDERGVGANRTVDRGEDHR